MFRQIKSFGLVAVMIGVVVSCTVPALGARAPRKFLHGERYINDNEEQQRDAYCLRKIVYRWKIDEGTVKSDKFATCTVEVVGDYQIIKCTGGEVPYNDTDNNTAEVTFSGTALDGTSQVVCAKWYGNVDGDGKCTEFIDYATFVGSIEPQETENRAGPVVPVDVVVENECAQEWNDEANAPVEGTRTTVYGSEIYYAEFQGNLHEDDMTEVLWTCVTAGNIAPPVGSRTECWSDANCATVSPYLYCGRYDDGKEPEPGGIDWYPPTTGPAWFVLAPGEIETFHLGAFHKSRRILFRFYTDPDLDGEYGKDDYEVIQFWVLKDIPAVSEWGLVVIALLILAAGTIVIRRRRAMAAQA